MDCHQYQHECGADEHGEDAERRLEAHDGEEHPAEEEANALQSILRARQDCHPAEQGIGRIVGHHELDGALRAHLGQILGDATDGLRCHHVWHDQPRRGGQREHQQRTDLE